MRVILNYKIKVYLKRNLLNNKNKSLTVYKRYIFYNGSEKRQNYIVLMMHVQQCEFVVYFTIVKIEVLLRMSQKISSTKSLLLMSI